MLKLAFHYCGFVLLHSQAVSCACVCVNNADCESTDEGLCIQCARMPSILWTISYPCSVIFVLYLVVATIVAHKHMAQTSSCKHVYGQNISLYKDFDVISDDCLNKKGEI